MIFILLVFVFFTLKLVIFCCLFHLSFINIQPSSLLMLVIYYLVFSSINPPSLCSIHNSYYFLVYLCIFFFWTVSILRDPRRMGATCRRHEMMFSTPVNRVTGKVFFLLLKRLFMKFSDYPNFFCIQLFTVSSSSFIYLHPFSCFFKKCI